MLNKQDYDIFINEYFPKSCSNRDEVLNIYTRVCENNYMVDTLKKYIELSDLESNIVFLDLYKLQINKILLYMPINDINIISYGVRVAAETILKYLNTIGNKRITVQNKRYRDLKEENLKMNFDLNGLNNIFITYAESSNIIHEKDIKLVTEIQYVEDYILNGKIDFNSIDRKLLKLIDNVYIVLIKKFNIVWDDLCLADRKFISSRLSRKRQAKIKKYFEEYE